jgi:hypothetical protein
VAHPEWRGDPHHVQAGAGVGSATVGIGMPVPGQPSAPPHAPPDNASGLPPRERVKPEQLVIDTALPQGEHRGPVSGFLYFAYTGRTSAIKSLELCDEDAVLKLR